VEESWRKVNTQIKEAAKEALGTRRVNKNPIRKATPWFTPEVKQITKEKKEAYLKYLRYCTPEEMQKYKTTRNRMNIEVKRIKNEYWESYTADMEHDMYGAQKKIWRTIRQKNKKLMNMHRHNPSLRRSGPTTSDDSTRMQCRCKQKTISSKR